MAGVRAVSTASQGIFGGTNRETMKVVPYSIWTDGMKSIYRAQAAQGRQAIFFTGELELDAAYHRWGGNGKGTIAVRGLLTGDGKRVFLQADNKLVSVEQLAEHENFHALARKDAGLVERARGEIVNKYGGAQLKELTDAYVEEYGWTDLSDEQILEEILADAYAGIDVFEYYHTYEGATRFGNTVREVAARSGETRVESVRGPPEDQYSISQLEGKKQDYGIGVILDTNLFDGVKPRDWGRVLGKYVYENLAGTQVTMYDENGAPETVELARVNDRVRKTGANNSHRVIDKLARYRGDNVRALATVHLSELLATSRYEKSTDEHSHQWMDENGWELRTTYVQDKAGKIYEATLSIANGRDRRILYDVNQVYQIDEKGNIGKHTATGENQRSRYQEPGTGRTQSDVPNDSIPSPAEKSKDNYSQESAALLREERDMLRERVEYLQNQMKPTERRTLRHDDVHKLANQTIHIYNSTIKASEIENTLMEVGNALRFDNMSYDVAMDKLIPVAQKIVGNAAKLVNGEELKAGQEIRDYLKQPMVISPQDAHSVTPEWGKWRNAHRGMLNVSIGGKGTPVDIVYAELSAANPGMFPERIVNPADQLLQMAEVAETLRPVYENPFDRYMAEVVEYCANELLENLTDEAVRAAPKTYADRMIWNRDRALARERENSQRALERVRESRDRQIKEIREHFVEVNENLRAMKADTAARDQLMRIAKRLQNRKLPEVNRALLNQYIGNLDTIGKQLTGQQIRDLRLLNRWYNNELDNNPDFIRDPRTEANLRRLSEKHINDLSLQEVRALTEVLQNIENEMKNQRKLIDSQDRRDTYLMGAQVIEDVERSKGASATNPISRYIVTETLSPMRMLRRITGWADNDPLYLAAKALNDGQRTMLDYTRRAWDQFKVFTKDDAFNRRISGKDAQEIEITGFRRMSVIEGDPKYGGGEVKPIDPVTVKITPAMRMSLYLHSLNDQNLRHIRDGGITVPDMELYKKGKIAEAYARGMTIKLTPGQVRAIAEKMENKERAFALAAKKYFNGMSRESINEVSEKLKGYDIATVDNYFPITTDRDFSKKEFDALKFDGTIEGMGFLQERQNFAHNPIMLRDMTDALISGIDQHARYYGLAIPVRNFSKILGVATASFNDDGTVNHFDSSVLKAIGQKWGQDGQKYIEKMMTDLQRGRRDQDNWAKALAMVWSNYAGAVLTLNASVAMKQAASYPTAGAVIGFKPLARAMLDLGKVNLDLINKYTPLQWYRSQGFSTKELGDIKKQKGFMDKVFSKKALNWIQGVDVLTTRKLWKAAEYYVRDNNKALNVGSEEYYKAVADVYNQIIEETQPNYTTMQRPQLLRSDDTLMGNLAMFKTQPFQNFNILYDALGNLEAKKRAYINATAETKEQARKDYQTAKKRAGWAVSSQIVQLAVFAGMTFAWNMFRGRKDKYEDKDGNMTFLSTLGGIGKDMIGGTASIIPFGSELWELADVIGSRIAGKNATYYGIEAVTPSAISDFMSALITAEKALQSVWEDAGSGKGANINELRLKMDGVADATTKVFGLPYENANNLFNAVYRVAARVAAGEYEGTYAYLRLTASPASKSGDYYDNLYQAYTNDRASYERIYAAMVESGDFDADKIKSAMETRMKKAQGVKKVDELESRYLSPEQQARYDNVMDGIESSSLWRDAEQEARDTAADALYAWAVGNSDGQKIQAKIDGGASVGLDETEYMLYLLALSMADKPTESGKYGTYTQDEATAATKLLDGMTDDELKYLWQSTNSGWQEKNNPYN